MFISFGNYYFINFTLFINNIEYSNIHSMILFRSYLILKNCYFLNNQFTKSFKSDWNDFCEIILLMGQLFLFLHQI